MYQCRLQCDLALQTWLCGPSLHILIAVIMFYNCRAEASRYVLSTVLFMNSVAAHATNREELQRGDIGGFVEEVKPCLAFTTGSSTSIVCMHAM